MKIRSGIVAWTLLITVGLTTRSFGMDDRTNFEAIAADVVIARPLWLVATAAGTALFIVTLPVAAMSKSVNRTARTLVAKPAQATFTRPLGDFSTVD